MAKTLLFAWVVLGILTRSTTANSLTEETPGRPADYRCTIVDEHFLALPYMTPVQGFTAYGGVWQVKEGVLWAGGKDGPKLVCQEPGFATGEVGIEMLLPDRRGGNAGFIVKVTEPGVGADRFNGYEVSLDSGGQYLCLGRHRQNFELIRHVPCQVPVNQWFPLLVRMTEKTLEIQVDGKTILSYEDKEHPLAAGAVGFRPWQRDARFRNFWIATGGRTRKIGFQATDSAGREVCGGWTPLCRGSARGEFTIQPADSRSTRRTQRIGFRQGQGEAGIAQGGPSGGIRWVAGQPYRGYLWVQSDRATDVYVSARRSTEVLAETRLAVAPGPWQIRHFTLTPAQSDDAGRFAVTLKSPGCVSLGRVLLQPNDWAWPETLTLSNLPPIAVLTRHPLSAPPAVGQDLWAAQPRAPGCGIRIIDPAYPDRRARTVFQDPEGSIYDMNLSYDAQTLYFSYRRKDEKSWHLWKVRTDGSGLKQLTDGPYYDVSPCPLPDGDLMFVSTRRFGYTLCQPGPASNLHRMSRDGRRIECVSMNTLSDFSPQMLPDGRVLFTRWEYIDRDLTFRQSLWTQNPDGTAYQLFFGNTVRDVGTFWQARPLPGRNDRLVATFAPHHGFPHGAIGLIDRVYGPEGPKGKGFTYITQEFPSIGDRRHEWSYRDPFPVSDRTFLCSYGGGRVERNRIYLLDATDTKRLVYEDPEMGCYFPMPLRPTPVPPVIPARARAETSSIATAKSPTGVFLLADVYRGLEPAIRRGRVKSLRVMEQIRKTEDLASRAFDQSPVMSYGTYYAKRCWGTVPVEEDGSAYFQAPALREIYFQALDAEGRELQRMTSGVQVMPGERISCIGCHEPRGSTPPSAGRMPLAALRPPRELEPPAWGNDGIVEFPKIVQPVLDKHCVKCHSGPNPDGGCDLTGGKTRYFNMAYDNLLGRSRSYRQHDMDSGEMLAPEKAKGKPLVHFFWLLKTPTGINQPLWTGCLASRLPEYFENDHCGRPIPREDRQRVYLWIDANVPYYGTYAHSRSKSPGKRDLCTDVETGGLSAWYAREFLGVYDRRCAECHGKLEGTTDWEGRFAWINFTHPHLSPALTAHLAKQAGGRGIEKGTNGRTPPLFSSTADRDYQIMLRAIEIGKRLASETPEADMAGFKGARPEP